MTTSKLRGLLMGSLMTASATVASAPALAVKPFNADYQANYMGIVANGRMTLASVGSNRWRYSLEINGSMANLSQVTVFEDHNGDWRPLSGTDNSTVLIKKVKKSATYDWAKGEASWSGDVKPDRAGPVKLQAGDLDAMLVNLAVTRDVAAGKPLRYRMVDDGRIKQLNYQITGKESVTINGKAQQATKIVRTDGEKQTIVWIVDGLPAPARILQRKNGRDEMDLQIKSVH